jgi:putative membrane protein
VCGLSLVSVGRSPDAPSVTVSIPSLDVVGAVTGTVLPAPRVLSRVTTLVLCVDRTDDVGRKTGLTTPVVGWEAVQSLVTEVGLADPEDSSVNCLLETLRVARELRDDDDEAVVAVVAGGGDSIVGADRSVAAQLDRLVEEYSPDSAVVVIDSVQDERLVPVVESRLPVDAVDRVVVRQAHDLESTYYLLKQFLADEELRTTLLVPTGIGLLLLPVLLTQFSPTIALAGLASLLGAVLLYKGLAVDELLADLPDRVRAAMYSGQVSVVTYVVSAGLSLVGVFLGALSVSNAPVGETVLLPAMQFTYAAVPWLALAALTASAGRLLDELISAEGVRTPYLNLPFGVVALGLVVRGFSGYFLEREGVLPNLVLFDRLLLTATQRLALFIVVGIVVSLVGVRVAVRVTDDGLDAVDAGGGEDADA